MFASTINVQFKNISGRINHEMKGNRKDCRKRTLSTTQDDHPSNSNGISSSSRNKTAVTDNNSSIVVAEEPMYFYPEGGDDSAIPPQPQGREEVLPPEHLNEAEKIRQRIIQAQKGGFLMNGKEVYETYFNDFANKYKSCTVIRDHVMHIAALYTILPSNNSLNQLQQGQQQHEIKEEQTCEEVVGGGCTMTQLNAATLIQEYVVQHKLKDNARNALLDMMHKLFPDAQLPLRITSQGSVIEDIDRFINCKEQILTFHCCPNGDHMFVGVFSNLTVCPNCNAYRFSACKACQKIHHIGNQQCNHSMKTRTPLRVLQYRPVISILKTMLESPYATLLFNYVDCDARSNLYHDIMFTETTKRHIASMREIYQKFMLSQTNSHYQNDVIRPVNILLSCGYDGVKFFNWKVGKVSPLVISILNMPPPMRKLNGLGTHAIGIFAESLTEDEKEARGKDNKEVEQFLIRKCFVEELLVLEQGVVVNTTANGKVFLQVRLINHNYDTPAMSDVFKVQCSQSSAGCPFCSVVEGKYKARAGSVVYIGHRCLLCLEHVLRYKGQSLQLSPRLFYTSTYVESDEPPEWATVREARSLKNANDIRHLKVVGTYQQEEEILRGDGDKLFDNDGEPTAVGLKHIQKILMDIKNGKINAIWYHDDICSHTDFAEDSFAHHVDYRFKKYSKKSHAKYLENACVFAELNKTRKKSNKQAVDGCTGLADYACLAHFNFCDQAMFDPFHVLSNQCEELIYLLKGDEGLDGNTVKYCKFYGFHPSLYPTEEEEEAKEEETTAADTTKNKKKTTVGETKPFSKVKREKKLRARYTLTPSDCRRIEYWVDSIIIPRGHVHNYTVPKIFSAPHKLIGKAKIHAVSALMELIITALLSDSKCNYPISYISYLRVHSDVITRLLWTQFTDCDLTILFKRIAEFLSLHEMVIPHTSAKITYHQMLDFPEHIKKMGPLRNFWSLYVERTLSHIKSIGIKKGKKFEKKTFENAVEHDNTMLNTRLAALAQLKEDDGGSAQSSFNLESFLRYDTQNKRFVYSDIFTFVIEKGERKGGLVDSAHELQHDDFILLTNFTRYEQQHLVETLFETICLKFVIRCNSNNNNNNKAPFLRYYKLWSSSFLVRVFDYYYYEYEREYIRYDVDVIDYLHSFHNKTVHDMLDKGFTVVDIESIKNYREETEEEEISMIGKFVPSDIKDIQKWLTTLRFKTFQSAYVLGIKFRSRGEVFKETDMPKFEIHGKTVPANHYNRKNFIISQWKNASQYSAWCKYFVIDEFWSTRKKKKVFKASEFCRQLLQSAYCSCVYDEYNTSSDHWYKVNRFKTDSYGQLNFFMKVVTVPDNELILQDEIFVSITGRKTEWAKPKRDKSYIEPKLSRLGSVLIDTNDSLCASYDDHKIFLSVRQLYSTPVALIPLNRDGHPIRKNASYNKDDEEDDDDDEGSNSCRLNKLLFVDLEPARLHLRNSS